MKKAAITNGDLILAGPDAPDQALCPICGRVVFLRSRHLMSTEDRTYYWQHERGTSHDCRPQRRVRRPTVVLRS